MERQRDSAASKGKQKNSQQTVPIQQDFLFIDSSKPAQTSRQGRRNARSFVMQRARRERPWSTSKHTAGKQAARRSPDTSSTGTPDSYHTAFTQPTTPTTPGDLPNARTRLVPYLDSNNYLKVKPVLCQDCQIFLCQPGQILCQRCLFLQPTLSGGFANGVMDPFGTSPVEVDLGVSELLNHFLQVMAPSVITVDVRHKSNLMRTDWFGTAMSNSGFMHSLLCTAALHMFLLGKGSFDCIAYHKAQAITAVQAALSDPIRGISDANIGAVFNLLSVEESLTLPIFRQRTSTEEQPNQRVIHLDGLRKMVELRGGLSAIKSNRCLQAFILWHSTAHAIASFEAPYLPFVEEHDYYFHDESPGYRPVLSAYFIDLCRTAHVKESLIEIIERALILTANLEAWLSDEKCPLDPLDIQNTASVLETRLLHWLRHCDHVKGPHRPLEDSLCVAVLIFVVRASEAFRIRPGGHHLHVMATKRLQKALYATSRMDWTSSPDLLLWILSIGAISTQGSSDNSWFVLQASLACNEFCIDSVKALLDRLSRCIWVGIRLDSAAEQLWDMISHLRLQPSYHTTEITGPLQFQVSEPDLTCWKTMDWMSLCDPGAIPGSPYFASGAPVWNEEGEYEGYHMFV